MDLLDNYHTGIIRYYNPVGYRRKFFDCVYIIVKIAIPFDALYKMYVISEPYSFKYTFIQPLHRFLQGEPISIFWQKEKWNPPTEFFEKKLDKSKTLLYSINIIKNNKFRKEFNYVRRFINR
jgi:hypothetical protein